MNNQKLDRYTHSKKHLKHIALPFVFLMAISGDAFSDTSCDAETDWFPHSKTPRPNDATFESNSNCVFHQWSWQMFLWLTQEENGQPRFLNFNSPQSLIGMEQRGLLPRMTKSNTAESFDEYLQAGTDGILIDHNNRAVYYSQYVNPTFESFIKSNDLTDPAKVRAMDPTTEFPIIGTKGTLELKASWKIVEEGEDTSDMFTMKTEISKLENKNGEIVINPDKTQQVTVALVGFHIGGVVNGHPEMIWATFEHERNAPNIPPNTPLDKPVSDKDYIFYSAGTTVADCNVNPANSNQLKLNERKQTLTPITQVCRQYEFGNAPGVKPGNSDNIQNLNTQVQAKLGDSIWSNYREVGAIWFLNGGDLKPGLSLADDKLLTGSLKLSNSTIETFTQRQSTMDNCFRCHNTMQEFPPKMSLDPLPATNLNISHAFQNIYFWSQSVNK
ncbi:hypothetical protein [Teredinibacter sp. KSP-S5-2]|uniref:hypothetical protein n=1 Tax=Teredinibacter sp. KSP-S5-2 TaxID=3034506 RepID=UPI0029351552|nr:hypothetical protein [Teredinibacter sp. KSP-S5-2]WNO09952.1 hypothetical protein P5V12_02080 [Teredinibacter sp. KSP-S5-2]